MPIRFIVKTIKGIVGTSGSETEEAAGGETSVTVEREAEEPSDTARGDETAPETDDTTDEEGVADQEEVADDGEDEEEATDNGEDEPAETATDPEPETEPAGAQDRVEEISGIGPTYSSRLTDAGIETVADLVGADAETVADAAQVSESRAADWIAQAEDW